MGVGIAAPIPVVEQNAGSIGLIEINVTKTVHPV